MRQESASQPSMKWLLTTFMNWSQPQENSLTYAVASSKIIVWMIWYPPVQPLNGSYQFCQQKKNMTTKTKRRNNYEKDIHS